MTSATPTTTRTGSSNLGLAVIVYVAVKMIYEGFVDHQVGILTLFA